MRMPFICRRVTVMEISVPWILMLPVIRTEFSVVNFSSTQCFDVPIHYIIGRLCLGELDKNERQDEHPENQ